MEAVVPEATFSTIKCPGDVGSNPAPEKGSGITEKFPFNFPFVLTEATEAMTGLSEDGVPDLLEGPAGSGDRAMVGSQQVRRPSAKNTQQREVITGVLVAGEDQGREGLSGHTLKGGLQTDAERQAV